MQIHQTVNLGASDSTYRHDDRAPPHRHGGATERRQRDAASACLVRRHALCTCPMCGVRFAYAHRMCKLATRACLFIADSTVVWGYGGPMAVVLERPCPDVPRCCVRYGRGAPRHPEIMTPKAERRWPKDNLREPRSALRGKPPPLYLKRPQPYLSYIFRPSAFGLWRHDLR